MITTEFKSVLDISGVIVSLNVIIRSELAL